MAKVLFKFGSRAMYDAEVSAGSILDNALYFLEDTNELYKGLHPIGQAHYYFGHRNTNETDTNAIARILGTSTPVLNDMLVIEDEDGAKSIFLFAIGANDEEDWQKITGTVSSSNVVFSDGTTLDQKIENVVVAVDGKSIVQDNDTGIISLAGYGDKYWRWDDTTEGYVLQVVDEQHPWKSGLTPRVYNEDGNFVIGWYEPNPTTAEGVATDLTALKQDVASLQTLVGSIGTNNEPSTGLVSRIESLENTTYWVGDSQIVPVNGKIQLNYFDGTHDGLVRAPVGNLSQIQYLNSQGNWSIPQDARIGDLTYNNITYNTVKEYIDAVAADFNLEWITMN